MTRFAPLSFTEPVVRVCIHCGCAYRSYVASSARGIRLPKTLRCEACCEADAKRVEAEEAARTEQERFAQRQALAAKLAMIPPRFSEAEIADGRVKRWVENYLLGDRTSLMLAGDVGVGKTHHAWAAWREIVVAKPETRLQAWRVSQLLTQLRAEGRDGFETIQKCQSYGLLILDDFGVSNPTDWVMETLYEIIDERYAEERPIIGTMNGPFGVLEERVGTRIASRLADMCAFVEMDGPDRRRG